jgi:hypothetical protein
MSIKTKREQSSAAASKIKAKQTNASAVRAVEIKQQI